MGHKQLTTTMRYCHDDQIITDMVMEVADLSMAGQFNEVDLDACYGSALIEYGNSLISAKPKTLPQDRSNTKDPNSTKNYYIQLEVQ